LIGSVSGLVEHDAEDDFKKEFIKETTYTRSNYDLEFQKKRAVDTKRK
jgi:hypothetical protein